MKPRIPEKMDLKAAKKLLTDLHLQKLKLDAAMETEREGIRERFPLGSVFSDNPEEEKAWEAFHKKFPSDILDPCKPFEDQGPGTKIWLLENLLPVDENKKCCKNCSCIFCETRTIANNVYSVCENWNNPSKSDPVLGKFADSPIYYMTPRFLSTEEIAKEKAMPLEEKASRAAEHSLNSYKKCLKLAKQLEKSVRKPTVKVSEDILQQVEQLRQKKKALQKEVDDCYDKETVETDFLGTMTKISLNQEKAKAFAERTGMCVMEAQMRAMFEGTLGKVEDK